LIPKLGYVVLEKEGDGRWVIRPETFNIVHPRLTEV
jgi:hypothetical protein